MMQSFLNGLAVVFMLLGTWIILLNWNCFYSGVLRKRKASSWIPLIGALLWSLGISLWMGRFDFYSWLPFLFDYGSIPGLAYTAYYHMMRKSK